MIENILKTLNFKQEEIKTYLILLETGSVTAGLLTKKLGIPRSSVYGFLKKLEEHGLAIESQKRGIKTFTAESPEKINLLFSQRIESLQKNQTEFKTLLPSLKLASSQLVNPKFTIFEGREGLQSALKDILLYYDTETQAFWPQKKMVEILTPEFFRYHNKERIKNRLSVRAIWPEQQRVSMKLHPYFGSGEKFKRQIRIGPKGVDADMGYWIYGNKTVFVSSQKESFGFILESSEFAELQKTQFEILWELSKPIIANAEDTKSFISELEQYY